MPWSSRQPGIERARPLLGTIVAIRAAGADEAVLAAAVEAAFARITLIHRLMSFQEAGSELTAINAGAARTRMALHPLTQSCLGRAIRIAELSGGVFDPVLAEADAPQTRPSWRDVDLTDAGVRFAAPLRLDLSGIAKGFAVDEARLALQEAGAATGVINAGGDLAVFGETEETVALRPHAPCEPAVVIIADGALASSDPATSRAQHGAGQHHDGRTGAPVVGRFASVAAPLCIDADALTKVVLAMGEAASSVLSSLGARAWLHDDRGWTAIGQL